MNEVLKQRLVGALILVALGVIFWPIIFVQPGSDDVTELRPVPPRPEVAATPLAPPEQAGLRASPQLDNESAAPDPAPPPTREPEASVSEAGAADDDAMPATRSSSPQPLQVDNDGVPVAWILQIASVSDAEKAETLRARLVALNYKAYVKKVERNGKVLHRIYLGPKFERAKLEVLQDKIDAEFGVSTMVTRYIP